MNALLSYERHRLLENLSGANCGHAAMINRTIPQHARGTVWRMPDDFGVGRQRISRERIRWTKNNQRWSTHRGPDVGRAGVICDHDRRQTCKRKGFRDARFARQNKRGRRCVFAHIL